MKLSLFTNDKSTYWDEIIFSIITVIVLAGGISLVVIQPSFWIFDQATFVCFGVIMILLAVMYIPCIFYRFMTNDKE